jgi:HK97 gp10 family phage protein
MRLEVFSDVTQVTDMANRATRGIPTMIRGVQQILARTVEQEALLRVPVDTGRLMRSIAVDVAGSVLTARAGAPYASFVEQGTRYMKPQPFLRPAVESGLKDVEETLYDHLSRIIIELER